MSLLVCQISLGGEWRYRQAQPVLNMTQALPSE